MVRKLYNTLRDFAAQMKKQNISAHAASTAFFFFVSLVPMLIVICTIIPYTPLTEEHLVSVLTDITPDMMDDLVESLIKEVYYKSAGVLSVAVVATIWSAAKGILALMRGLNAIYDVEEERNYFVVRTVASFYTLVMLVAMVLSLFIMVFGNRLVDLTMHKIPQLQILVSFSMKFRFISVWGILTLLFAFVYTYIPNIKLRFKEQVLGSMFTAISWSVFSWGFSLYIERTGSFGVYGSLSIIVISMIWMYCCMYIMMVGAYLNRYFSRRKGKNENMKNENTRFIS